jgi:cephalosporin-C deacetylase-like acetyl esterase
MMVERRDVEFEVEGGDRLRGWLFVPENRSAPHPAISMAHGYAGVKEHGLERFARAFAEAGFVVLVHDHRNFGSSDGAIRHDNSWLTSSSCRQSQLGLPRVEDARRVFVP